MDTDKDENVRDWWCLALDRVSYQVRFLQRPSTVSCGLSETLRLEYKPWIVLSIGIESNCELLFSRNSIS